jgi:hypothetical protein
MRVLKPIEAWVKQRWVDGNWNASVMMAKWLEPSAIEFYNRLENEAFRPGHLVRVLPTHGVIYLMVPKAASTRIRATLGAIGGRHSRRLKPSQWGKAREVQGLRSVGVRTFYHLATSPTSFRFTFVRNPYARLLSFWASKFQNEPLVSGQPQIDDYLARRESIDRALPAGADKTLSFEDFVTFAATSANSRQNQHLQLQDDILSVPGIPLDFIGRMESFNPDFTYVLDRLGASEEIRREALVPLHSSRHRHWSEYYTPQLAERIYRAYERDFDRFKYPRSLSG